MTGHALFGNPKKTKLKIFYLGERRRWVMGEGANYSYHGQRPWASLSNCLLSRDREGRGTTWPTGRIIWQPPSFPLVCGSVSRCAAVVWSSGPSGPVWAGPGWGRRLGRHRVRQPGFIWCLVIWSQFAGFGGSGFHLARNLNGWCTVTRKLIGFWAVARKLSG